MVLNFCLGVVGVVFVLFFSWKIFVYEHNRSILEKASLEACAKDLEDGFVMDRKDHWGKPVVVRRVINDERTAITYTVISAGKDGEFNTDDDYETSRVDHNVMKILGKAAGESTKEFLKGFFRGKKEKNRFEK